MYSSMVLGTLLGASLSGTVQTEETQDPVYGATVTLFDERLQIRQMNSGLNGGFQFDSLPSGTYRLHIEPPQEMNLVGGFVHAEALCDADSWSLEAEDQQEGIEAYLSTGGTLSGSLIDDQGDPIPGAAVWAAGADESSEGRTRMTTTDETGSFEVQGLAGTELRVAPWVIWVDIAGWPSQYLGPTYDSDLATTFEAGPGLASDAGTHALLGGITVSGTVSGPTGPVPDSTVHVYAGGQVVTVETDEDGTYRASGLPPGDVLPWASADGLATTYYPDQDRPTQFLQAEAEGEALEGADLILPTESVFQALFVDPETGEPIPEVSALLYNDTHTVGRGDKADSEGVLRIDGLHGGDYEIYIWGSSAGYSDDWSRDSDQAIIGYPLASQTDADPVEISLHPSAILQGRVLDLDGQPIGSAWVIARSEDGGTESTMSDSDGSFLIAGLSPHSWSLEAQVTTACPGDPAYVETWWPSQVNEDWAPKIEVKTGQTQEGLDILMPYDGDLDGMGDEWEELWELDIHRNDASEDPDEDGYLNLTEYLLNTHPRNDVPGCSSAHALPSPWVALLALPLSLRRRS